MDVWVCPRAGMDDVEKTEKFTFVSSNMCRGGRLPRAKDLNPNTIDILFISAMTEDCDFTILYAV
jgi:hypothetical protein